MGKKNTTRGGSKFKEYTVMDNVSGSGPGGPTAFTKIRTVSVKGSDGKAYTVPVDNKGKVPEYIIYQRFLNVSEGSRNGHERDIGIDLSKEASTVYVIPKGGFTPEDLVKNGWWAHPNESDIKGVDDPSTSAFDLIMKAEENLPAMGKIAIMANDQESKRIRDILNKDFTKKELKEATKNGGIVIMVGNAGKGASGFYRGRQPGVETPLIVLDPGASEDTIVHEFVHHSRRVDPNRYGIADCPYPTDETGKLTMEGVWKQKYNYNDATNWEEAATVLEAAGRTRAPERYPTGYYQYTPGGLHKEKTSSDIDKDYQHDRDLMIKGKKNNSPQRGKRVTERVNARFDDSKISELKYKGSKTAKKMIADTKANGDFTEKPKGKAKGTTKKPNAASASMPTPGMATANLKGKKGRPKLSFKLRKGKKRK